MYRLSIEVWHLQLEGVLVLALRLVKRTGFLNRIIRFFFRLQLVFNCKLEHLGFYTSPSCSDGVLVSFFFHSLIEVAHTVTYPLELPVNRLGLANWAGVGMAPRKAKSVEKLGFFGVLLGSSE